MKAKYKVGNWPEYNKALKARGRITLWFNEESVQNWSSKKKTGKKGRPQSYADQVILTALTLRSVFHLSLRAAEGFMHSLAQLMKLTLKIPSYTQVSRRSKELGEQIAVLSKQQITDIVIDSTGLKVYGEGEWKVHQHGVGKRRTWRKLHLGVCPETHTIIVESLTTNAVSDCQVYPGFVSSLPSSVERTYADGAYDKQTCYKAAHEQGITPIVPPRRNAVIKDNVPPELAPRAVACGLIESLGGGEAGRKVWKKIVAYHKRSLAETAMYRFKQVLGDKLCSRSLGSQQTEVKVKCMLLNKMTSLGMPLSERVAA